MLYDIVHGDAGMAFVVHALSVADKEDLGGFMLYKEIFHYFIGQGPVAEEVQVIEVDSVRLPDPFQPVLDHGAGGTAGAMLKNELRADGGFFPDLFQLRFRL
jgi:hypothetical protein